MKQNTNGEMIFDQQDLCNLLMQGQDLATMPGLVVDQTVDIETAACILDDVPTFVKYNEMAQQPSMEQFDHRCQSNWFMPQQYKDLDIAKHVLDLCKTDAELQRVGQELMMYQERNLFDLLKYLTYLVDTMKQNNMIWGVGRGSSVASYVLYLLGVHRIDSLFYDLDPGEFLR
jgi:DNA polymerase III alpha subunit